jgi:peptidyl-prolyl cis-trans isomerase C
VLLGRSKLAALFVIASATAARADDADPIAIRVGDLTMRASDVARRLAAIPTFQLTTLGRTPDEIRKRFADTVLVPEMLDGAEAERRRLGSESWVRGGVNDAFRRALIESLRRDAAAAGVPDPEVRAYYEAHRDDYQRPERIRIFRILVDDEALARKILSDAKGPGGPERWSRLARDHSVDAATKLRSGALGFVLPDGRTDVPQLVVNPVLHAAAAKMKDGELCPDPVREGGGFAVVWRRGTLPKIERTLEAEHDTIVALLVRQKVDRAVTALLDELRKRDVHDENPTLLDALPRENAVAPSQERPEDPPHAVSPIPHPSERGLR